MAGHRVIGGRVDAGAVFGRLVGGLRRTVERQRFVPHAEPIGSTATGVA